MSDELAKPPTSQLTTARLSLGNTSPTVSTRDHLAFQLDHAMARDAVLATLDVRPFLDGLRARGLEPLMLHSAAADRKTYLRRPDLGRTLSSDSIAALHSLTTPADSVEDLSSRTEPADFADAAERPAAPSRPRIAVILADGLSALALERHALPLLDATLPLIPNPCSPIPVVINARVAIADPIGELLHADLTLLLIGERPGLSSPDSLGVYLTWDPRPGRTDAERNCISNIRGDAGLNYAAAAHRIAHYIAEATRLRTTGTALKDPAVNDLGAGLPSSTTCSLQNLMFKAGQFGTIHM
jgi:ethanolamine ammonia-lyase small subunit